MAARTFQEKKNKEAAELFIAALEYNELSCEEGFYRLDKDHDGFVSLEDLVEGAEELDLGLTCEDLRSLHQEMDLQNEGLVELDSWMKLLLRTNARDIMLEKIGQPGEGQVLPSTRTLQSIDSTRLRAQTVLPDTDSIENEANIAEVEVNASNGEEKGEILSETMSKSMNLVSDQAENEQISVMSEEERVLHGIVREFEEAAAETAGEAGHERKMNHSPSEKNEQEEAKMEQRSDVERGLAGDGISVGSDRGDENMLNAHKPEGSHETAGSALETKLERREEESANYQSIGPEKPQTQPQRERLESRRTDETQIAGINAVVTGEDGQIRRNQQDNDLVCHDDILVIQLLLHRAKGFPVLDEQFANEVTSCIADILQIEVSEVQWHNMSAADSQVTLDMHINANDIRHHAQLYGSTVEFHLFKLLSSDIESGQSKLLRRKGLCGLEEIVVHGSMKSSYKLRIQSQHPSSSLPPAASADTCSSSSSVCTDQADLTPRRNASSTLKDTPEPSRSSKHNLRTRVGGSGGEIISGAEVLDR